MIDLKINNIVIPAVKFCPKSDIWTAFDVFVDIVAKFVIMKNVNPKELLLTDYEPVSVFKLAEHHPHKAKFRAIDMHAHPEFAESIEDIKA